MSIEQKIAEVRAAIIAECERRGHVVSEHEYRGKVVDGSAKFGVNEMEDRSDHWHVKRLGRVTVYVCAVDYTSNVRQQSYNETAKSPVNIAKVVDRIERVIAEVGTEKAAHAEVERAEQEQRDAEAEVYRKAAALDRLEKHVTWESTLGGERAARLNDPCRSATLLALAESLPAPGEAQP